MRYLSLALPKLFRLAGRRARYMLCRHNEGQVGRWLEGKIVRGGLVSDAVEVDALAICGCSLRYPSAVALARNDCFQP